MLQYRKELDGLRALAVIAVLFYHVNLVSYPLLENTFFRYSLSFMLTE